MKFINILDDMGSIGQKYSIKNKSHLVKGVNRD